MEEVEKRIREADTYLADISESNPNVWFELGFAIAAGKPVVLVCLEKPDRRFPFDIQHRAIITYKTESARDFDYLKSKITARLKASIAARVPPLVHVQMPPLRVRGMAQIRLGSASRIPRGTQQTPEGGSWGRSAPRLGVFHKNLWFWGVFHA